MYDTCPEVVKRTIIRLSKRTNRRCPISRCVCNHNRKMFGGSKATAFKVKKVFTKQDKSSSAAKEVDGGI